MGARTWGLDDPGLVGLGRVAVTLPVGEALHHLAAADKTLVRLGARGVGEGRGKRSGGLRGGGDRGINGWLGRPRGGDGSD
jgi:hypothetical protein